MTMLPWLIIGALLLGGIAMILYNFFFVEEEEEPDEAYDGGDTLAIDGQKPDGDTMSETLATTTEEYKSARKSRMIALKESLEASLETRHGTESASEKDRMSMPWFMLVGSDGSGKTTLLANTGLPLPYGPAFEVDSKKKDAGRWWLYEDAVVLEAPPAAPGATSTGTTLTPDQTQAVNTSEGWNTLLHMLRRERPDSPLNGIIVTISAPDLVASRREPDKLTDQAERIRTFLERTRRVLGVRLPIHLLVTKCDALPGFRAFADNLPEARRHDVFGWSNPNKLETPFNPDWVDLGIAAMRESLEDLRDELLAAPDELVDPDGLFVFVSEFAELHEPLKEFATKLIGEGQRRPPLFFRGMYFCGDAIEGHEPAGEAARKSGERATVRISSEVALGASNAHNLVFLRSLFQDRIFREAGLARPMSRMRLSRDRRVVLAQVAAVLIAIIGGAGLWTSLNGYRRGNVERLGLRAESEELATVLAGMAIDLDEVKRGTGGGDSAMERRMRDAAVLELVAEMRDVESIRKSAFIPASWFSPLPDDVRRSMVTGIESIVLPVTRQRLQERVDALLGAPDESFATAYHIGDARSLAGYLRDVRTLSRNVARFNTLAAQDSGTVEELALLLEYLFAERPLRGDSVFTADFVSALRQARAPRIVVTPEMTQAVRDRAVGMVASVARAAARQLSPPANARAESEIRPEDDIRALRGLHALVELADDSTGLVAAVSDSAILGMPLTQIVLDSISAELRHAARTMSRDEIAPADAERRLRIALAALFELPLMDSIVGRPVAGDIAPGQRMRWDVGRLELALSLRGDHQTALATMASPFQGQSLERLRRAFQSQLQARAVDAVASAQRFTPLAGEDPALEVRASAENLSLATPRILRAKVLLDTLGAQDEAQRLLASGARQAEQTLALARAQLRRAAYFEPNTERVAAWLGVVPINFAAMNVSDSTTLISTMGNHATGVWQMLGDVERALAYLRLPGMDSTRTPRLVDEWTRTVAAVRAFERRDPASTLGILERFIREDMAARDVESCGNAVQAAAGDTLNVPNEIFLVKLRQFRAAMAGRCASGGVQAANAYERMRALFASRVAGRFPFAPRESLASAPDADPAAVREFLRTYDAFIAAAHDVALRSDRNLRTAAAPALAFLDSMKVAREFLSPLMDDNRRAPSYGLALRDRTERWSYGEPLYVMATSSDSSDKVVQGGWSALRFAVQRSAAYEGVRFYHPLYNVELTVPVFPAAAPRISP